MGDVKIEDKTLTVSTDYEALVLAIQELTKQMGNLSVAVRGIR